MEKYKMKPRIKSKFIKALRSGEYAQGHYLLCQAGVRYDRFCVAGVLIDLYLREHRRYWEEVKSPMHSIGIFYQYRKHAYGPPKCVMTWAGLPAYPGLIYRDTSYSLMGLNDTCKLSFNKIADLIEKQW